jgi:hypothetical protein
MKSEAGGKAEAHGCQSCCVHGVLWRRTLAALEKSTSVVLRRTFGCMSRRLEDDFDDEQSEEPAREACSHHKATHRLQAAGYLIVASHQNLYVPDPIRISRRFAPCCYA